jgi:hypothetical protein
MAPNVTISFWAPDDINGTPFLTIDDEDPFFKGLKLTPDLYGLGGWELTMSRTINFGVGLHGATRPEAFVRFMVHAYSDTDWYWGGFIQKRQMDVVDREELGAEEFVIGGPGPKAYLDRYRLGIEQNVSADWNLDLENGVWRWAVTATAGKILRKVIAEDEASTPTALVDMTQTFDGTDDSNSVAWANDIAGPENYETPIGSSLLEILWDLEDLADLFTDINLGTLASPVYELNAYQSYGQDVSSGTFGMGVCLLREGVNIANESLTVEGVSMREATHVIVEGKDGTWATNVKSSWSPGDYVKWGKIEYTRSSHVPTLERAGLRWLRRQENGDKQITVEVLPGASEATGLYFPMPGGVMWLGNTITLDTSADGTIHYHYDYNNEDQLLTGFELSLGPAGDDSTADKEAKSWDIKVRLNGERAGFSQSPNQTSAATGNGCTCPPFHPAPPCGPSDPGGIGDPVVGVDLFCPSPVGTTDTCGPIVADEICWQGSSEIKTSPSVITPGTYYSEVQVSHKYGGLLTETFKVWVQDSTSTLPDITDTTAVTALECRQGADWSTLSLVFEVPSGYDRVRFSLIGPARAVLEASHTINEFTLPSGGDDPNCMPEGTGGTSPYAARSDDPRFSADDQHVTTRVTQRVTNNSGGDLEVGDVVIPDITFDGHGVTTTTTANSTVGMVGVMIESVLEDEDGLVLWSGAAGYVNVGAGTAADGDYLFTSTTAGAAQVSGTRATGAFARVIRDAAGDPLYTLWWGIPDGAGGGGGHVITEDGGSAFTQRAKLDFRHGLDVTDDSGSDSTRVAVDETELDVIQETLIDAKGDLIAGSAADTAGRLAVGSNGRILVADSAETLGIKWATAAATSISIGGSLGDVPPATPGTYDEEFTGTADTLPTNWAWTSAPSGSDLWSLNSRWPGILTVEGTGNTQYTLTRTSFTAAATFGIWAKFHVGPFLAGDKSSMRMYVSNSGATEQRGVNYRGTGVRTSGARSLRIIASVESAWGSEATAMQTAGGMLYMGMTRDGSNNFISWYSRDGIAWDRLAASESHTITIDRIRFVIDTSSIQSLIGLDWIRYRTDNNFPRP